MSVQKYMFNKIDVIFQRINVGEHILHFLVLVTGCNSAGKLGTSEIYRVTNVATGKNTNCFDNFSFRIKWQKYDLTCLF